MDTPEPRPRNPWRRLSITDQRAIGLVLGVSAVLIFVAVNSDDDPPSHPTISGISTADLATTPPASGGIVSSPDDLIASAGVTLPCTYSRVISDPVDARAQSNCDDDRVIIRVYDSADPDGILRSLALLGLNKATFLVGKNWTISADNPVILPGVQSMTGGKILNLSEP